MRTCPSCSASVEDTATRCDSCGVSLVLPRVATFETAAYPPPPPPPDPNLDRVVAGKFKILVLLGEGGMGRVYRARHLGLDKDICIKVLRPALLEDATLVKRFEREAKAASRLNHPNCIQILDSGQDPDGTLYIAMELVNGSDLRRLLRDEFPLGEPRICRIMAQVLSALDEAHAKGIIHRDLKPENIMVEQRRGAPDTVKVLDFGIAKIMDPDTPRLTRTEVVCGTPLYMSPEQATGQPLDPRSDIYTVGVILYHLTTGTLPFKGRNSMEILTKHASEMPEAPRDRNPKAAISPAMEALILKALEKEPLERPQTCEEFREDLFAIGNEKPAPAGSRPSSGSSARGKRTPGRVSSARPIYLGALAGAVITAAAAGGGWVVWSHLLREHIDQPAHPTEPRPSPPPPPVAPPPSSVEQNAAPSGSPAPPPTSAPLAPPAGPTGATAAHVSATPSHPAPAESSKEKLSVPVAAIAGGTFQTGCEPEEPNCDADEPVKTVTVEKFHMMRTELTVATYDLCVAAGRCTTPGTGPGCNWGKPEKKRHPINCINWFQAKDVCAWLGQRLPTSTEWEFAAKGGRRGIFPWGNASPDHLRARYQSTGTAEAGSFPAGQSARGLLDLAGNVWEWTSTARGELKEARGGSWKTGPDLLRSTAIAASPPAVGTPEVGVRCVN